MKVFQPIVFQGNLNKTKYFEGWYFKHVSANREQVLSVIPGIALTQNEKHAFIQVIDGITGKTWNINYPVSTFRYSKNRFEVWIGKSFFSSGQINLNIENEELELQGEIQNTGLVKYPSSVLSPGIMGWYSFVPFMECKHGIASVYHSLKGTLLYNSNLIDFNKGTGYIEKDWGTSFPESWVWLHCNTFFQEQNSFTFSVAKIPWLGSFFIGHICFLYADNKFYLFATYNGSKITRLNFTAPVLEIEITNKTHILKAKAVQRRSGELKAPVTGEMNRMIKESVDSTIEIELREKTGKLVYMDFGNRAGLEIIEKILNYFK